MSLKVFKMLNPLDESAVEHIAHMHTHIPNTVNNSLSGATKIYHVKLKSFHISML